MPPGADRLPDTSQTLCANTRICLPMRLLSILLLLLLLLSNVIINVLGNGNNPTHTRYRAPCTPHPTLNSISSSIAPSTQSRNSRTRTYASCLVVGGCDNPWNPTNECKQRTVGRTVAAVPSRELNIL